MIIHFGKSFDRSVFPAPWDESAAGLGHLVCGPMQFLALLESQLGLSPARESSGHRTEYLRRKVEDLNDETAFYFKSFQSDDWGTARRLLSLRDELLLAGWDARKKQFGRLEALASLERISRDVPPGIAERIRAVSGFLPDDRFSDYTIYLHHSTQWLEPPWLALIDDLGKSGASVTRTDAEWATSNGDLAVFKQWIHHDMLPEQFAGDGSLLVVRVPSDSVAADALSTCRLDEFDVLIADDDSQLFADVLGRRGLPVPSTGSSASAHPVQQVLFLALELLWDPVDADALLAFLLLPISPIHRRLAGSLARSFADSPGLGRAWLDSLEKTSQDIAKKKKVKPESIRQPVEVLINGERYDSDSGAPVAAILARLDFLESTMTRKASVASTHAQQIRTLIGSIRETRRLVAGRTDRLTRRQVLRIVKSVTDSRSNTVPAQLNAIQTISSAGALRKPVSCVLWWNATDPGVPQSAEFWTPEERSHLAEQGVHLPARERSLEEVEHDWYTPLRLCRDRLIIFTPETRAGTSVAVHPVVDRIIGLGERGVRGAEQLIVGYEEWLSGSIPSALPTAASVNAAELLEPIESIALARAIPPRETESHSSLEKLFYRPENWFFDYALRLRPSGLRVSSLILLRGKLSHAVLEAYLKEGNMRTANEHERRDWVTQVANTLMQEQAITLLAPENNLLRSRMLDVLPDAAVQLERIMTANDLTFESAESNYTGLLNGQKIMGRIDLTLKGEARKVVIDFKYGGEKYRRSELFENRGTQLALYAHLVGNQPECIPAYLIINTGALLEMGPEKLKGSAAISGPDASWNALWQRIEGTYEHRRRELDAGRINIPTEESTLPDDCLQLPDRQFYVAEYTALMGALD